MLYEPLNWHVLSTHTIFENIKNIDKINQLKYDWLFIINMKYLKKDTCVKNKDREFIRNRKLYVEDEQVRQINLR